VSDPAIAPFLLAGERVLWSESPRELPAGSAVFDSAIGCGCLGILFLVSGSLLVGSAIQALRGFGDPTASLTATLVTLGTGWFGRVFLASLRTTLRKRRERARRRYVVTTKRVLVLGTLEAEILLEVADVDTVALGKNQAILVMTRSGKVGATFDELEDPPASHRAIDDALTRARAEPA
jgi:hypothetical protein